MRRLGSSVPFRQALWLRGVGAWRVMITVMASAAAVRSTTAIADARDTARVFL